MALTVNVKDDQCYRTNMLYWASVGSLDLNMELFL